MNSFAVLKRVLVATAVAVVTLSFARPAAAAPFYFYAITAVPNWGLGNPQPVSGWSAITALNGSVQTTPFAAENYVSISLLGYPGYWYAYDTFAGEANGFIGADVSIPTAQWLTPAAFFWTGGPAGGGAFAFFNSFNPFTGIFYANEMIVLDPDSCSAIDCLSELEGELGSTSGPLTPSLVTLDSNGDPEGVTLPGDKEDPNVAPDPNGTDYFASGSVVAQTPESPTAIYVLLGMGAGAGVFYRRGRLLPTAA
jgi:hypothetical protein